MTKKYCITVFVCSCGCVEEGEEEGEETKEEWKEEEKM